MISATRELFGETILPILLKYLSAFFVLSCGLIFFNLPTVFYKLKLHFMAVGYLASPRRENKLRRVGSNRALVLNTEIFTGLFASR